MEDMAVVMVEAMVAMVVMEAMVVMGVIAAMVWVDMELWEIRTKKVFCSIQW
jgi:hypothetical protein